MGSTYTLVGCFAGHLFRDGSKRVECKDESDWRQRDGKVVVCQV